MVDLVCPFCQNTGFEIRDEPISGASSNLPVVRCSACGAAISVVNEFELGQTLRRYDEQVRQLNTTIADVHRRLVDMDARMNRFLNERAVT